MTECVLNVGPWPEGFVVMAVPVGPVGTGGSYPYAVLNSLPDVKEFLERELALGNTGMIMTNIAAGVQYSCIVRLSAEALEAIQRKDSERQGRSAAAL